MPDNSVSNKRIAKNTLFLYLRMFLVLVVSLFTTRIVLQQLGVVDYGIYNVVGGFVSMFAFLNTSLSNGIQRFYNFTIGKYGYDKLCDVYNTALRIQFILAITIVLLLETIGLWYMYTKMVIPNERFCAAMWVFQFSVMSLVLVVMQIPYSAAIIAYERMDCFAYISIYDVVMKLIIAYSLNITPSDRLIMYGLLVFLVQVGTFLMYYLYSKKHFRQLTLKITYDKSLYKSMLSFSGWNVFGSFAYMIKSQGLNMLLNVFFGPVINAARGVSNMILTAIQGFQSNIVTAFRPQIVQSYAEEDNKRVLMLFYSLSKVSYLMLAVLSIPVILELDYILHLWLGDTIPDYTIPFTVLVLINMVVSSLNTPVSQVVHATGRMKVYQNGTSIVVCAILPLAWVFLKLGFDATSVYWVSLGMTIINQVICNILLKRVFDYNIYDYILKVILPCMFFTVIAPIIPWLLTLIMDDSFGRLIITTALSIVSSIACGYILVLSKSEKYFVNSIIRKIIQRHEVYENIPIRE